MIYVSIVYEFFSVWLVSAMLRLFLHQNLQHSARKRAPAGTLSQGLAQPAQVFIDSKNSELLLVLRSLSSRKSIASMVPIGLRMRRRTYIFFSTAGSGSR